jgi:hypothetical protein
MPMNFVAPMYSDELAPIWIVACDADCIIAYCNTLDDASRLVHLGFQNAPGHGDHIAVLRRVADDVDLAMSLMALRDIGIPFGFAPAGWPPSAVFELLRDRGLVQGHYKQIFRAHNTTIRITLDN